MNKQEALVWIYRRAMRDMSFDRYGRCARLLVAQVTKDGNKDCLVEAWELEGNFF